MANTGYKQATVAYKVSQPGGAPLDIDGNLISVSGKRQAIALLDGQINPNPAQYEIEIYFTAGGMVDGKPTNIYDTVSCPVGYIYVTPNAIILDPSTPSGVAVLESSNDWAVVGSPATGFSISQTSGMAGSISLEITLNNPDLSAIIVNGAITTSGTKNDTFTQYRCTSVSNQFMFIYQPGKSHYYTGVMDHPNLAGVIYQDINHVFLGYQFNGTQTLDRQLMTIPEGTHYIGACSLGVDPVIEIDMTPTSGYFVFQNSATLEQVTLYVAYVNSRDWILETGTWNMLGFWYNDSLWNF